jgi:hypothetical protein
MARYGLIAVSWVIFMMTLAFPALALDSHRIADDYIRADFTVEDGRIRQPNRRSIERSPASCHRSGIHRRSRRTERLYQPKADFRLLY